MKGKPKMKIRIALVLATTIAIAIALAPAPNKNAGVTWNDIQTVRGQKFCSLDVLRMGHSVLRVEAPGQELESNRKIAEQFNSMPNRGQRR